MYIHIYRYITYTCIRIYYVCSYMHIYSHISMCVCVCVCVCSCGMCTCSIITRDIFSTESRKSWRMKQLPKPLDLAERLPCSVCEYFNKYLYKSMYIYIRMCVCMCMCLNIYMCI